MILQNNLIDNIKLSYTIYSYKYYLKNRFRLELNISVGNTKKDIKTLNKSIILMDRQLVNRYLILKNDS